MPGSIGAGTAVWTVCLAIVAAAAESPKSAPHWTPRDGDVLVLLGDDLTQQAGYSQLLENFLLTRFPDRSVRVVNAGVQGSLTRDALDRFTDDVAVHRPTHVAVMLGMSDSGLAPHRDDRFEEYQRNIAELDRRIRALGAQPIYLSPAMFDVNSARNNSAYQQTESLPLINATLSYYGVWLREFALAADARFVDLHGAMSGTTWWARSRDPEFTLLPNGHEPNDAGQLVIAATILRELGLAKSLSSIHIVCDSDMPTAMADGGSVQNLYVAHPGSVSFVWQAEALPWPNPMDEDLAERWRYLIEPFNRETLHIHGLAADTYELLIDDRLIGQFSQRDFEKGIKLHRFSTPQREQAEAVAARNAERTAALIRPARADWSILQRQSRLRRELGQRPDDAELMQELTDIQPLQAACWQRQAQWLTAAEISLALLVEQVQPLPRRFVIRPVSTAEVQGRVLLGGVPIPGALVEFHDSHGLSAMATTDAMGFYRLKARMPHGVSPGEGWLVVLAKMVLPPFISVEQSGHRVTLRSGLNEIELHFESETLGQ